LTARSAGVINILHEVVVALTSKDPARRYQLGQVSLEDYFRSEEDQDEVFAAIHRKVVGVLLNATCPDTGMSTGSQNYIRGMDGTVSSLVNYVMQNIRGLNGVFGHRHMPKQSVYMSRHEWDRVIARVHHQIVSAILVTMREDLNLWYMTGDGDWMFSNLIRIEYDRSRREARQAWRDERSFHGRPSKQGRRRAKQNRMAPGVSIGGHTS